MPMALGSPLKLSEVLLQIVGELSLFSVGSVLRTKGFDDLVNPIEVRHDSFPFDLEILDFLFRRKHAENA